MVVVEVCVESVAGVRAAAAAGAQRVELCSALIDGGLTPSAGALARAVDAGGIDLVVLVRPRGGDFLYDEDELAVMERDVDLARVAGAAGVALGCLTRDGAVDVECTARLVARADGLAVTFHRAFDLVRAPERELETLVELGVARVLTSGGAVSAFDGRERIAALVRAARGRLTVVAAGGVRPENVRELVRATGVSEVHASASARRPSAMGFENPDVRLAGGRASEVYAHWDTDAARVGALVAALRTP
jgi:copper homeostasis protein